MPEGTIKQNFSVSTGPLPASRKVYRRRASAIPDLRVAMREIDLIAGGQGAAGARLRSVRPLYRSRRSPSTSAPGLPPLRDALDPRARRCRGACAAARVRPEDNGLQARRGRARCRSSTAAAASRCAPRPARARDPARLCARRHHHAGDGIHRHPREPRPRAARRGALRDGESFGAAIPELRHAGIRARRGRARPRHHPRQHQPSRKRADDHRPQFPGQDQRQYRQLGRHLVGVAEEVEKMVWAIRWGADTVMDLSTGKQHPHHPRMDHPQLAGADRHGADLSGAGEGRRQGRGPDLGDLSATR